MSTARRKLMPHLSVMTHHCKNRELTVAMAARYELDEEHVSFITGSGKNTNKVEGIVEDANRLREEQSVEGSQGAFEGEVSETDPVESVDEDDETEAATLTETTEETDATGNADDTTERADSTDDDEQAGLSDFM